MRPRNQRIEQLQEVEAQMRAIEERMREHRAIEEELEDHYRTKQKEHQELLKKIEQAQFESRGDELNVHQALYDLFVREGECLLIDYGAWVKNCPKTL